MMVIERPGRKAPTTIKLTTTINNLEDLNLSNHINNLEDLNPTQGP